MTAAPAIPTARHATGLGRTHVAAGQTRAQLAQPASCHLFRKASVFTVPLTSTGPQMTTQPKAVAIIEHWLAIPGVHA